MDTFLDGGEGTVCFGEERRLSGIEDLFVPFGGEGD
jgi:hypothetical protein